MATGTSGCVPVAGRISQSRVRRPSEDVLVSNALLKKTATSFGGYFSDKDDGTKAGYFDCWFTIK
jgi:hypothetical protein